VIILYCQRWLILALISPTECPSTFSPKYRDRSNFWMLFYIQNTTEWFTGGAPKLVIIYHNILSVETILCIFLTLCVPVRFVPFPSVCDTMWSLLPCCLQHSWIWSTYLACACRWREINFSISCNPITATVTKVWALSKFHSYRIITQLTVINSGSHLSESFCILWTKSRNPVILRKASRNFEMWSIYCQKQTGKMTWWSELCFFRW
jgi:hypothetical protein